MRLAAGFENHKSCIYTSLFTDTNTVMQVFPERGRNREQY